MYQPLRFFSGEVANGKVRSIFLSWSPSLLISLRIFVFLCCRQFVCLFFLRSKYQAYEKKTTITITFEFLISKVRIFFNLIQVKVSPSTNDISFLSLNILLYWTLACLFLSSFVVSGVVVATCTHFISDVRLIIGNDNVVIFEWIESLAFFLGQ